MAASEATWHATLQEVQRQALLHLRGGQDPSSTGSSDAEWVKVEGQPREAERSEMWPQSQWQVAFEILFCQMPTSTTTLRPHQDDLLFFVTSEAPIGSVGSSSQGGATRRPPLLVRRRSRQLPGELGVGGARAGGVDWRASLLLNVVLQTGYCLSVATCKHHDLHLLVDREGPCGPSSSAGEKGSSIREVCQVVYASPSRVHVNLDASRSSSQAPEACYPDIAFAVEDFQHAFNSVVLSGSDECYCVLLWAEARESWHLGEGNVQPQLLPHPAAAGTGAAAGAAGISSPPNADSMAQQLPGLQLRGASSGAPGPSESGNRDGGSSSSGGQQHKLPPQQQPAGPAPGACPLVFSGFVSHELLSNAMAPKLAGGGGLLGGSGQRTDRVVMRGPGGLGMADVAVTSLSPSAATAAAAAEEAPAPEVPGEGTPARRPFFSRASWLARGVVEAAKKAAAGGKSEGQGGPLQMRCALMTLVVPVDALAASIMEAL